MINLLLAELLTLLHFSFVVFAVLGGFLIKPFPRLIWLHLPALAWGIWIELSGGICPLTPLESDYRQLAGLDGYEQGFLVHYLGGLLYPGYLTLEIQRFFAGILATVNLAAYLLYLQPRWEVKWPLQAPSYRQYSMLALTLLALLSIFQLPPMAQDPIYHQFADQRPLWGFNHGLNSLSNLAILLPGLWGLWQLLQPGQTGPAKLPLLVFCLGAIATGLGSFYYHLEPNNFGLLIDRLGMSLAFAGFLSLALGSQMGWQGGKWLQALLIFLFMGAVVYWYGGELRGRGDLRPSGFVQFWPLLLLP